MRIVFFVMNYMPHQVVSIKTVLNQPNTEVHAFQYKESPSAPTGIDRLFVHDDTGLTKEELLQKVQSLNPDLLVVAGWAVPKFVWVARQVKKEDTIPVVSYSDTQWQGSWRQRVNCLISPFHLQKAFTHLWVAGIYQYEYARRLGFSKNRIHYNALSCDLDLFHKVSIDKKQSKYPKNILYIGRFVPVKGLNLLMEAWSTIPDRKGWTLTLVGDGPLKSDLNGYEDVIVKEYMPQEKLIEEMQKAGCFVLPSVFEPWALVIHEAAAAGLPLIVTDKCGAAPHFVINGYNGYQVRADIRDIQRSLEKIMHTDTKTLLDFSKRSRELSKRITPELGAAELLSVLN